MDDNRFKILIVDDNAEIHEDFKKILGSSPELPKGALSSIRKKFFQKEDTLASEQEMNFQLDSAYQGREALDKVMLAMEQNLPYALAFVDIRMPPGWDGIETIQKLWEVDPDLEVVICSAYSDYSWREMTKQLKASSQFVILKKPFDPIEILQLASGLTKKWHFKNQIEEQIIALKKLSEDLEKSLLLTNTTLDSTQEGILVIDPEGRYRMSNSVFATLWGFNPETVQDEKAPLVIEYLAYQTDDPEFFIELLTHQSIAKIYKSREWRLKSNKVIEIYIHPLILNDTFLGNVCSFRDITQRKEMEDNILHQATHDSLTNLPNRVLLNDRINQAILHAKRFNLMVGILVFDLDNFKEINDTYGHLSGDELLVLVTQTVKTHLREADTFLRLGGDEFVIIIAAQSKIETLSQRAHELIEATRLPKLIGEQEYRVTASIGVSIYPKDGLDPETLIRNADSALYRAKELGRNTFVFYEVQFNETKAKRFELTCALRRALEKNEFTLNYQPLVDVKNGNMLGVEALLRWDSPGLDSVSPQIFISLIEEAGLMAEIGHWILRTACFQGREIHDRGHSDFRMAVNISVVQFNQKNFIQSVKDILAETKFNPKCLEFEITESLILTNVSESIKKMLELKELGISISIDDFGTGYSALSYLKYFPFDKVKIDKSFIDGINKDKKDESIVDAIIAMTQQFGIKVLAEGVEKSEQVDFIRDHACGEAQGYFFSKPLAFNELYELISMESIKN